MTAFGMSTPVDEWETRLAQVRASVHCRRVPPIPLDDPDASLLVVAREVQAGRYPVCSFQLPGDDWVGAAAGSYDPEITDLGSRLSHLSALGSRLFLAVHLSSQNDGTPVAFASMQRHVLPLLASFPYVDAGVIASGLWWTRPHATDDTVAEWLPRSVLDPCEILAITVTEDAGLPIRALSEWASRRGVSHLGVAEFTGRTPAAITSAGLSVMADPRYVFAACRNDDLSGDRLRVFRALLTHSRPVPPSPITPFPTT